jgi:hypothetical protein
VHKVKQNLDQISPPGEIHAARSIDARELRMSDEVQPLTILYSVVVVGQEVTRIEQAQLISISHKNRSTGRGEIMLI